MKNIYRTGNETVDKMSRLRITGNVIPSAWFHTIRKDTGKPNMNAIVILSDIVYWYRPLEIRDEATGKLVGMKKRFRADLLQRTYQQIADQFGISKRDAVNAVIELEKLGVIKRVFRMLEIQGQQMPNVLFISLCVERLEQLTYPDEYQESNACEQAEELCHLNPGYFPPANGKPVTENDTKCHKNPRDVPLISGRPFADISGRYGAKNVTGISAFGEHTKNTEPNFGKDFSLIYQAETERIKEQIGYEELKKDVPYDKRLDELVETVADVMLSHAQTIRVNKEDKPAAIVKAQFRKLNMFHIRFVLQSLKEYQGRIWNVRAVIVTALYNSVLGMEHYYENLVTFHQSGNADDMGRRQYY